MTSIARQQSCEFASRLGQAALQPAVDSFCAAMGLWAKAQQKPFTTALAPCGPLPWAQCPCTLDGDKERLRPCGCCLTCLQAVKRQRAP